ncbi:SDR family NAD(P)-dependent oxidoreductase [Microcella pacifica]|uniref:SDR family NAD(P)-dependent oxidoreductase n=1 Tax=Microcella pacifica TaxID=2591847 RepID=UPI001AEF788A|nr:SDR family oxidoreductase [Microcella pacifica]
MTSVQPASVTRVVVTGATGIAAAVATELASRGAQVFAISRTESSLAELAARVPLAGFAVADLSDEREAERAFSTADDALGGLDGLVAVAGGSGRRLGDGPLHEIPLEGWDRTLGLNLTTTFLAARETIRALLAGGRGGSLLLTTSVLGWSPSPEHFSTHAYAAAKAAIVGLTRTLAAHYADDGIRVNAIAPGLVETPMAARAAQDATILNFAARKQPVAAGILDARDVARLAVPLLDAVSVTGQVVAVDGGWSVSEGRPVVAAR